MNFNETFWVAIGSIATLCAVIYALYKDLIRAKYLEPKLKFKRISIKKAIIQHRGIESNWHRIVIKNEGLSTARNVRILLESVLLQNKEIDPEFTPVPLNWVGYLGVSNRYITRGETALFDLFYRTPKDQEINFQYGNPILQGNFNHLTVDLYTFRVVLYCDNANPTPFYFKIKNFGSKFDDTEVVKI